MPLLYRGEEKDRVDEGADGNSHASGVCGSIERALIAEGLLKRPTTVRRPTVATSEPRGT